MSEKKIETKVQLSDLGVAKLGIKIQPIAIDPAGLVGPSVTIAEAEALSELPEIKQYPVVPAPAPQVPPAEVGVTVTVTDLSGRTDPIAMGDPIKSGDYIKLDEPVKSPAQGKTVTLDENSRAAFEKAVSMFNNPPPTGAVSYGKFEDFKAEVLKAFTHMGLNVNKHFTQ